MRSLFTCVCVCVGGGVGGEGEMTLSQKVSLPSKSVSKRCLLIDLRTEEEANQLQYLLGKKDILKVCSFFFQNMFPHYFPKHGE